MLWKGTIRNMLKKYTKVIEGHTISMSCDESVETQGQALFRILEQQNKLTPLFSQEACTIRIGWTYYYIEKQKTENDYILTCPDFQNDPTKGKMEDITAAIMVQNMMMDTLSKIKRKDAHNIFFADSVTVSQAVVLGRDLCLQRMETKKKGDSGWTIVLEHPSEEDKAKPMVNVLVCHLLKLNPALMGLLVLPVGAKVITSNEQKSFHINLKDVEK